MCFRTHNGRQNQNSITKIRIQVKLVKIERFDFCSRIATQLSSGKIQSEQYYSRVSYKLQVFIRKLNQAKQIIATEKDLQEIFFQAAYTQENYFFLLVGNKNGWEDYT